MISKTGFLLIILLMFEGKGCGEGGRGGISDFVRLAGMQQASLRSHQGFFNCDVLQVRALSESAALRLI